MRVELEELLSRDAQVVSALEEEVARLGAGLPDPEEDLSALKGVLARAGLDGPGALQSSITSPNPAEDTVPAPVAGGEPATTLNDLLQRLASRGEIHRKYRIEGEVGSGGMGTVSRVWDADLRRHLAMKSIHARQSDARGQVATSTLARFLEEAQVTGQLDHPGIVPVHELGLDPRGNVYFTMKLVHGQGLDEVFELVRAGREGWSLTRAVGVLLRVCEAMSYAHSKGVIHRDLKPANVMVGRFGEVYVMDWGLARVLDERSPGTESREEDLEARSRLRSARKEIAAADPLSSLATHEGAVMGTPAFMAPEQAMGRISEMGPASDVYAVGAMLYELLAGHAPYRGTDSGAGNLGILARIFEGPPEPLSAKAGDAPAELISICEKAMQRDPEERYADTSAMAEDLRAFLEGRVVQAYETGAWAEARKWIQRNRGLATASAAAALLAVTGLVAVSVVQTRGRRVAQRERNNVLRLSALQQLGQLEQRASGLWPPTNGRLPDLDVWLRDADELVAGLEPDPDSEDIGHLAQLEALRDRARPWRESDHSRWNELVAVRTRLAAARREQRLAEEAELEEEGEEVTTEGIAETEGTASLVARARQLTGPQRSVFGQEAEGLRLARAALERATEQDDLPELHEAMAWACVTNGRDEEARANALEVMGLGGDPSGNLHREIEEWIESRPSRIQEYEAEEAELSGLVAVREDWSFDDPESDWWHTELVELVSRIQEFSDPEQGLAGRGIAPARGWGVRRRRDWAESIEERSVSGPDVGARWKEAIEAIASSTPAYRGLSIEAQLGLVPLGPDPHSGFWEFAHLATGLPPERDADGHLAIGEEHGLVFVLLPGGRYLQGAQSDEPDGPNYDPVATAREGSVHEVRLSPFFISKYEMTQAQWLRLTGENPSHYTPETYRETEFRRGVSRLHPVEQVSWQRSVEVLGWFGLELPSEAQWEYAARGGTRTPWSTGIERESLEGCVNLADQAAARGRALWASIADWPELDDSWATHAPVGTFEPNPFGLHDVHGNVYEWCLDSYEDGFYDAVADLREPRRDPVCRSSDEQVVCRGGSFKSNAAAARSAMRTSAGWRTAANDDLGVRPARKLD